MTQHEGDDTSRRVFEAVARILGPEVMKVLADIQSGEKTMPGVDGEIVELQPILHVQVTEEGYTLATDARDATWYVDADTAAQVMHELEPPQE